MPRSDIRIQSIEGELCLVIPMAVIPEVEKAISAQAVSSALQDAAGALYAKSKAISRAADAPNPATVDFSNDPRFQY